MTKKSITRLPLSIARGITPEQVKKKLQSSEGRFAEFITGFSGSMMFVYVHAIAFALFFIFRPFQIELFNIILSLEAVFLATFILVAQKRQALVDEYRELEEEREQEEEEREQEELEEEVEDIQKDLDDIKNAINFIQQKVTSIEKIPNTNESTKK